MQAITLTREMLGANYSPSSDSDCFIGSVPLTESLDNLDELNIFYVRQQILANNCDIFIRCTSRNHISRLKIPTFVNKLLKHIDCDITLSFTIE